MKWISSSLMLWQTTQILVAGIHLIGLIVKDETPVTGAKSNITKPRRESCESDKIASLVCSLSYISPLLWQHCSSTTVFSGLQQGCSNILFPCCHVLIHYWWTSLFAILSFKFKGKEREKLLPYHSLSCILNNNTKSLSFLVQCIKPSPSIQCSWSTYKTVATQFDLFLVFCIL